MVGGTRLKNLLEHTVRKINMLASQILIPVEPIVVTTKSSGEMVTLILHGSIHRDLRPFFSPRIDKVIQLHYEMENLVRH